MAGIDFGQNLDGLVWQGQGIEKPKPRVDRPDMPELYTKEYHRWVMDNKVIYHGRNFLDTYIGALESCGKDGFIIDMYEVLCLGEENLLREFSGLIATSNFNIAGFDRKRLLTPNKKKEAVLLETNGIPIRLETGQDKITPELFQELVSGRYNSVDFNVLNMEDSMKNITGHASDSHRIFAWATPYDSQLVNTTWRRRTRSERLFNYLGEEGRILPVFYDPTMMRTMVDHSLTTRRETNFLVVEGRK